MHIDPEKSSDGQTSESYLPLLLDLVEWIDRRPHAYSEVMDVWRTSCPRLPVWEDAIDSGLVERRHSRSGEQVVVTDKGRQLLVAHDRETVDVQSTVSHS